MAHGLTDECAPPKNQPFSAWIMLSLLLLEVTQLPRERWHPAGSGSTDLAERPPEMAVIATA